MTHERDVLRNVLRLLQKAKTLPPADAAVYLEPVITIIESYSPPTAHAAEAAATIKALATALSAGGDPSSEWDTAIRAVELWDKQFNIQDRSITRNAR